MRTTDANHLDIGEAFRFAFRSKGWLWKFLLLDLCALLSVTVVGAFVFYGYLVEISRQARTGKGDLPSWDRLGNKLRDGWFLFLAFLVWAVPLLILAVASAASCTSSESGNRTCTSNGVFTVLLSLASLLYYLLLPAIRAQLLGGGLSAALNVPAVFRRAAFKPGLTVLVLLLYFATIVVGFAGLIALLVGVLITYPLPLSSRSTCMASSQGLRIRPSASKVFCTIRPESDPHKARS